MGNKKAKKTPAKKTGARGLRSVLEESLLETIYELPNAKESGDSCVIDGQTIRDKNCVTFMKKAA